MIKYGIRPHFTFEGLTPHLKPLLILFASTIAISFYTFLDTLMLGFLTNYEEVGYYSNAMSISRLLVTAVTSLSIVAVPRVSYFFKIEAYDEINSLMKKSFSIVSFLAIPICVGLLFSAHIFVPLFFGEHFMGSIIPLMILSVLIVVNGLNNLSGFQTLIGMGLDKYFLYSVLTGTIVNFVLNCFFIPIWGSIGASVSSVTAEAIILIVTLVYVYRKTPIRFKGKDDFVKALFGSLLFIPLYYCLKGIFDSWLFLIVFVFLGAVIYITIEFLLKNSSTVLIKQMLQRKLKYI